MMYSNKKKRKERTIDNPIEAVTNIASDFASSATNDLVSGVADSAFQQIFGKNNNNTNDIFQNEELDLDSFANENSKRNEIAERGKQRLPVERNIYSFQESENLHKQIEQLLKEIKMLAQSTQNLTSEVQMAAMEQMPVNPGKYHLNFFEWLVKMIRSLRERVDESASWLRVFQSKKKQKQYWSMFKKHKSSFSLSSERSLATQVG